MNLHGLVRGAITTVNPDETVTLSQSTGTTKNADFSLSPTYSTSGVGAQVQALTGKDLRQIEGLNLNGTLRKFYFFGEVDAIVRSAQKGGDLITRSDESVWLVNQVLEQWPDWCAVVATLQNGA